MKSLKLILVFAILAAGGKLVYDIFPPYSDYLTFKDYCDEQLKVQSYIPNKSEEDIAQVFADRAAEMKIPLTVEQIRVTRMGSELNMEADYVVHVDYFLHPFDLNFHVRTHNRRI